MIGAGVCDNDETRLLERSGDVVREGTWGETASNRLRTGVRGELEDCTMAVWPCANHNNVFWGDWSDNSGSENKLFPGLPDVNEMDA